MSTTHIIPDRLLLRPQEAANALGVSLRTLMDWAAEEQIPVCRLGDRCLRFPLDGLRQWVAQRTSWPTAVDVAQTEQDQQTTEE